MIANAPFFDCDSHIVESLENLTRHQPAAFKEKYRLERRETPEGKYPWFPKVLKSLQEFETQWKGSEGWRKVKVKD